MKSIGLIGRTIQSTPPMMENRVISGGEVAENNFIHYLLSCSTLKEYHFVNFKDSYNHLNLLRAKLSKANREKSFILHDKNKVVQENQQLDIDVLFDTYEDFKTLILFRDLHTRNKPPISFIMHGSSDVEASSAQYPQFLFTPFQKYDSFICTSKSYKSLIEKYLGYTSEYFNRSLNADLRYNGRLDIVPLGVDTSVFCPSSKEEARTKLGLPLDAFIILYHGRIDFFYKADLLPLLMTVDKLTKQYDHVLLLISGGDSSAHPHLPSIKRYIEKNHLEKNVVFLPQTENSQTSIIYNASDVFTSPVDNIQECFGITPIEAMACGCPQVVSDWNGYKETVIDGITGFRVPTYWCDCDEDISRFPFVDSTRELHVGAMFSHYLLSQSVCVDMDAYLNAFIKLIENPQLRNDMSRNSRKHAVETYDWTLVIRQYEDLWAELIRESHRTQYIKTDYSSHLYNNRFFKAFQGYPSRILEEDDILIAAQSLVCHPEGPINFVLHIDASKEMLNIDLVQILAYRLRESHPNGISFRDLIAENRNPYSANQVKRSLMFLMKRGYESMLHGS